MRDLALSPIGEAQGLSALVYQAQIAWRDDDDLPTSLIFKFASAKQEYRDYATTMGTYRKEVRFYQKFGPEPTLPLPKIYYSKIDEDSGHFLIVMEDLSAARMASWFGTAVDDVQTALTALAGIHAKYWGGSALTELDWLASASDPEQSQRYKALLQQLLPPAKETFTGVLTPYVWSVLETWLERWDSVRSATAQGAMTLVHREADMRQMFFPTQGLNRFVLFDWQSPELGWGAADACRLITTSLDITHRRQHEQRLVVRYLDQLRAGGVNDLTEATLWHQIKLSLLMIVLGHAFTLLWVETEETAIWRHDQLAILGAAAEDWRLLETVKSAGSDRAR